MATALETGIGGWSDQEIIAAIREGRRPGRQHHRPADAECLYRDISDRDAQAIVAYICATRQVKNAVPKSVAARSSRLPCRPVRAQQAGIFSLPALIADVVTAGRQRVAP